MQLPKLNFEQDFDFKIKQDKDTFFIYDLVRRAYLVLTPEEWVRQHWVHYFHFIKGKSLSSLIMERKIELNGTTKRIFTRNGKNRTADIIRMQSPSYSPHRERFRTGSKV